MMNIDTVIQGDCQKVLKDLPDKSVDCCVTSPPYYGLRDYGTGTFVGGDPNCPHKRMSKYSDKTITGHAQEEMRGNVGDAIYKTVCPLCGAVREDKQIGLEETPEEYIERLVQVFREVKRVLKDDGTLWLNIGDSYNGYKGNAHANCFDSDYVGGHGFHPTRRSGFGLESKGLKPKDLVGIPWMLAFALRADGWYLRQDIIWHKPNPMPESVKDRCTKSHEYIFLLSKKPKYYFDYEAIQEQVKHKNLSENGQQNHSMHERRAEGLPDETYVVRNKRDVWSVTPKAVKEAHFATFPEDLIEPCIKAGCREDGIVLDPFFGSGTTGRVAVALGRHYIGIELNEEYIKISDKRTNDVQIRMF